MRTYNCECSVVCNQLESLFHFLYHQHLSCQPIFRLVEITDIRHVTTLLVETKD